jgi:hypothetical protein
MPRNPQLFKHLAISTVKAGAMVIRTVNFEINIFKAACLQIHADFIKILKMFFKSKIL